MIQLAKTSANAAKLIPYPVKSADEVLQHISASSLKLYLTCSLKFYFKKVLMLQEPSSPALVLGKAVHGGIEAFHKGRWRGTSFDNKTVVEAYHTAFLDAEAEGTPEYKKDQRAQILERGEAVLLAYLESDHAKMADVPRGVEVHLEDDFPELPSPLVGYVDLVREGNVPVDFKTCAATPNLELEAFQHELQLTAYQILLEAATGKPVDGREVVFLVKTKTPKIIVHRIPPADEQAKERFWSIAQAAVDGIYHERWVPQPGMHCAWCAFRQQCANWTGEYT